MTIHEAMIVLAACDTTQDDCHECPLWPHFRYVDAEGLTREDRPCAMLGTLKVALALSPFPAKLQVPNVQG